MPSTVSAPGAVRVAADTALSREAVEALTGVRPFSHLPPLSATDAIAPKKTAVQGISRRRCTPDRAATARNETKAERAKKTALTDEKKKSKNKNKKKEKEKEEKEVFVPMPLLAAAQRKGFRAVPVSENAGKRARRPPAAATGHSATNSSNSSNFATFSNSENSENFKTAVGIKNAAASDAGRKRPGPLPPLHPNDKKKAAVGSGSAAPPNSFGAQRATAEEEDFQPFFSGAATDKGKEKADGFFADSFRFPLPADELDNRQSGREPRRPRSIFSAGSAPQSLDQQQKQQQQQHANVECDVDDSEDAAGHPTKRIQRVSMVAVPDSRAAEKAPNRWRETRKMYDDDSLDDVSSREADAGEEGNAGANTSAKSNENAAARLCLPVFASSEERRYHSALRSVETAVATAESGDERVHKASSDMVALLESWNAIAKDNFVSFSTEAFNLMVENHPDYSNLFLSATVEQQARTTFGMIGKIIYAYMQPTDLLDLLTEIGARHCLYGVERDHFIAIGDAFLTTFPKYVSASTYASAIRPWKRFWRVVVELLTHGETGPRALHYAEVRKRQWILELQAFYAALTERQRATPEEAPRQHLFVVTMLKDAIAKNPSIAVFRRVGEPLSADRAFEAMGRIINNLDDEELVQEYVTQLGIRHYAYKLTPRIMTSLRGSFLAACEFYMHDHELWRCVPTMRRTLAEIWEMISCKWVSGWSESAGAGGGFGRGSRSLASASLFLEKTSSAAQPRASFPTTATEGKGLGSNLLSTNSHAIDANFTTAEAAAAAAVSFNNTAHQHHQQQQQQQAEGSQHAKMRSPSEESHNGKGGSHGSHGGSRMATQSKAAAVPRVQRGQASHAPQTGEPGCILFTDIEASTNLWEANRSAMAMAVQQHNVLLRDLLTDYGGYEVKTVGDSFMIATRDAHIALQIALGVQLELMRKPIATGFRMSAAVPHPQGSGDPRCWRDDSIRVRIGIHYTSKISATYDGVHRRFDYYGPSVNCAARVEAAACGGQILMTKEAVESLKGTKFYTEPHSRYLADHLTCSRDPKLTLADLTVFEEVGAVSLKGIAEPVHLVSVLPSALAGRTFQSTLEPPPAPSPSTSRSLP